VASCRDSGKISKTLSLQRFDQGQDWFLQLSVKDSTSKENMTMGLPVTGAELHTLKTLSEVPTPALLQKSCSAIIMIIRWDSACILMLLL